MEHRWGHRYGLDLPVDITQGRETKHARLRDVSITGSRVATATALPLLSQLRLLVDVEGYRLRADAWVVRAAPGGYGLEWLEADSIDVHALLEYAMRCQRHLPALPARYRQGGQLRIA